MIFRKKMAPLFIQKVKLYIQAFLPTFWECHQHCLNWEKCVIKSQKFGNFRVTKGMF